MPEDMDLKPPSKRPKFDNESDIEEENLIEEAERMQEQNASKEKGKFKGIVWFQGYLLRDIFA